jgi:hypothetical protein
MNKKKIQSKHIHNFQNNHLVVLRQHSISNRPNLGIHYTPGSPYPNPLPRLRFLVLSVHSDAHFTMPDVLHTLGYPIRSLYIRVRAVFHQGGNSKPFLVPISSDTHPRNGHIDGSLWY